MANLALGGSEVIQIIDSLAKSLDISKDSVLDVLEDSIAIAARKKYGNEFSIRASVSRRNGEILLFRDMVVVSEMDDEVDVDLNHLNRIPLEEAIHNHPDCKVGEVVSDPLPPIDIARVAAQTAKHVMSSGLKEVISEKEYDEFILRKHELISGTVDKIERGNAIVKLGSTETMLPRSEQLRSDRFKQGDRVRAMILDVTRENKHTQITLSRTDNLFIAKLFEQEVPEVFDKVIEIKSVARDPGSRAKVAVYTRESSLDPVGSCVGIRGARVMAITNELNGEKIDVIEWSSDTAKLVMNALSANEVAKVIIDEEKKNIDVVIPEDQLSLAIGRRGQNIRLASQLVGWGITALSEDEDSKRRVKEFNLSTKKFIDCLDLDEILAQLLVSEGYSSIADLASSTPSSIGSIEGLDNEIAEELISRAKEYLEHNDESSYKPSEDELEIEPENSDGEDSSTLSEEISESGDSVKEDDSSDVSHEQIDESDSSSDVSK